MSINVTIDPDSNPVALNDRAAGWRLTEFDPGNPDQETQWATSVDVEGSLSATTKPTNRTVTARVLIEGASAALLQAQERTLGQKVGKLVREGGELELEYPSGDTITFDVIEARQHRSFTPQQARMNFAEYELTFICKPYGRGEEQDLGDNVEATLPVLVFTEANVPGDVYGLGRLVIDNDASADQWWLAWGLESRYYSSSANAALFYEAEGRTAMGGSSTSTVADASGGGSNVMGTNNLLTSYRAILSTQATGGGAHLSHVGSFRVYARIMGLDLSTTYTVALEWSEGDFLRASTNTPVEFADVNTWHLFDLGLVTLTPVTSGTQRWEGRVIAKSDPANSDLYIDYLMLVPVNEGSGVASSVQRSIAPTSYVGEDHFTTTTAGNALNARVAPTGGTWATSGDATDFVFDDDVPVVASGEHIRRAAVSGTNGRYAILGSTNYINAVAEVKVNYDTGTGVGWQLDQGPILRWVDSSNYLVATFERVIATGPVFVKTLKIKQVVAGTTTTLASANFSASSSLAFWTVQLLVTSVGIATASIYAGENVYAIPVGTLMATCSGSSSALVSGGALATGKPGIWDRVLTAGATTRYYDDFLVSTTASDAVTFASQSLELRHDRVTREDSAGGLWAPVSSYQGDYLRIPPAGSEDRSFRMIVKMCRADPASMDPAIDDASAQLYVTPRYYVVPDA